MKIAVGLCLLSIVAAQAQIGRGWVEYHPERNLQQENSAGYSTHTDSAGVETFKLWKNPSGARQRCEIRVHDDYTSGSTQFEGYFFMVHFDGKSSGDDVCIAQVWLSMMTSVTGLDGGSMRQHSSYFATQIFGKWVRMNLYHNATTNKGEVWLDGVKKWAGATKTSSNFYHKYGLYNQAANNPEIKWRDTRFFRGGTTEGGFSAVNDEARLSREKSPRIRLGVFDRGGNPTLSIIVPEQAGTNLYYNINGAARVPPQLWSLPAAGAVR